MEENIITDTLRQRLVFAGLSELEEHGIADFSLRRVAVAAGVSCAAPYRHFKDKDELILAIIDYVLDGWVLLSEQISDSLGQGGGECIIALSQSLVRFFVGNGNFRSILTLAQSDSDPERRKRLLGFDEPIINSVSVFSLEHGLSGEDSEVLALTVLSLIYGTLVLISRGNSAERCISNLRNKITSELVAYL